MFMLSLYLAACHSPEAASTVSKCSWRRTQKASETCRAILQLQTNILPSSITLVRLYILSWYSICVHPLTRTHTHTHTHIYIYIYIYRYKSIICVTINWNWILVARPGCIVGMQIVREGRRTACPVSLKYASTYELRIGQTCTNPGRQVVVPVAPTWNSEVAPRFVANLWTPDIYIYSCIGLFFTFSSVQNSKPF